MHRALACFLWTSAILAQAPLPDPLQSLIQAYWTAHTAGHFAEAAARRDGARRLLDAIPANSPQYPWQVRQVADLYYQAGLTVPARSLIGQALARTPAAAPARADLLDAMAAYWEQDRNLLQCAANLEQAVRIREAGVSPESPQPQPFKGGRAHWYVSSGFYPPGGPPNYLFQHLANVYRQLGRRQDAEAMRQKILAQTPAENRDALLASNYEQENRLDDAAALYRKQAAQPGADPRQAAAALQSLASVYQRQQRYGDAADALRQAIQLQEQAPGSDRGQSLWMRTALANTLSQAGNTEAADRVFEELQAQVPENQQDAFLTNYANYLANSKRAARAESLLRDYRAGHPNLEPWQEYNLLSTLASVARRAGDNQGADEFQAAAAEKQQRPSGQKTIGPLLSQAQAAGQRGDVQEAFRLALAAIAAAPSASDREQLAWAAPALAAHMAGHQAEQLADQFYRALLAEFESWSPGSLQPLWNVQQNYARFLIGQRRWSELPDLIQRHGDSMLAARGPESGWLEDVLRLRMDAASSAGAPEQAVTAAEELVALQQSVNGTGGEPYLRAIETLAGLLESSGQIGRALPLREKAIAVTDALFPTEYARRGFPRVNMALALARQKRFDEALQLVQQAQELAGRMPPPQPDFFTGALQQIRDLQAGRTGGTGFGYGSAGSVLGGNLGLSPVPAPPPPIPAKVVRRP